MTRWSPPCTGHDGPPRRAGVRECRPVPPRTPRPGTSSEVKRGGVFVPSPRPRNTMTQARTRYLSPWRSGTRSRLAPKTSFMDTELGPQRSQRPPVLLEHPAAPFRHDAGPALPRVGPCEEVPKLQVAQDGADLLLFVQPRQGQELGDRGCAAQAIDRRHNDEPVRRAEDLAETGPHAPGLDANASRCVPSQPRCSADGAIVWGRRGFLPPGSMAHCRRSAASTIGAAMPSLANKTPFRSRDGYQSTARAC